MAAVFSIVTGWTIFGGLTLAIGAVVTRWVILPRAFPGEDSSSGSRRTAATVGLAGATLVLVGVVLYFLRQLQEFRDPFVPWTEDANLLLTGTSWGTAWLAAAAGAVVLTVAMTIARTGRRSGWWLATPVAFALGAFPGFTGHASGVEELRSLTLFADSVHVWSAGAWIGGLAVVLFVNRSLRETNGGHSELPSLVPTFSRVAMASVGALVVTGTFASWVQLPDLASIWTTGYGRILIAKLAVVGVVLAMGGRNFRILTPRLGTDGGNEAMRRSAALELAIGQIVLILTAVLVRTSPLGH
jgi:putative copper export protein